MADFISQKTIKLKLHDGWKGVAAEKWSDFIFEPNSLTEKTNQTFKSENGNVTALKQIECRGEKHFVVVKKIVSRNGVRAFVDLLRTSKSLRNFKLAILLNQNGIEAAEPVAALWHNTQGNIYVTEYIRDSLNLYEIAFGKNREILDNFSARKAVIIQVAELLAKLHKANFWHRDPKAGNFIAFKKDNTYKVKLIDMDGIKQNLFDCGENRVKTLSKLAQTLTRFKTVNFADLYRGFKIYCRAMDINDAEAKELFRKVERETVTLRLLTAIEDSKKFK